MVKENFNRPFRPAVMGMTNSPKKFVGGCRKCKQIGETNCLQIIQRVQTLAPSFESVNEGMQAQATGAEQISEALLQLTESAQTKPWNRSSIDSCHR